MAGGKLTPRQKMINMMYLVLTALLALNVAKDILRSFDLISASLHTSAEKLQEKNTTSAGDIKSSVEKEIAQGNRKNANLPKLVDEVTLRTADLVNFIEEQVKAMQSESIGGTDPATGKLKQPDNIEKAYRYWMVGEGGQDTDNGGRGSGKAKELKDRLQAYVNWSNEWYKTNNNGKPFGDPKNPGFPQIALDPKDDPSVPSTDDGKQKTWEYFIFHGSPVVADVAMLQKFKNDVRVIEAEMLTLLRSKLGEVTFKIDSLVAMDAPVSQVVAAGLPFETKLFVAASSKQAKPQFTGSGSITLSPDGQSATLKTVASGAVIPKGALEGKQNYSATIRVPKADGGIQEFRINKTFTVRKPEISITSAAITIMYQNCGNEVNIDVPALGTSYNPVVTADNGGKVIQSKQSIKRFMVIPPGNTVTLTVKSNTNGQIVEIGKVPYKVIPPPKPSLKLGVDGKEWDGIQPIRIGSKVEFRCVPDANFRQGLPRDARYLMKNVVIKAASGLGSPSPVAPSQDSRMAPQGYASVVFTVPREIAPGSRVFFQAEDVFRINFEDRQIKENFSIRELTLSAIAR